MEVLLQELAEAKEPNAVRKAACDLLKAVFDSLFYSELAFGGHAVGMAEATLLASASELNCADFFNSTGMTVRQQTKWLLDYLRRKVWRSASTV